MMGESDRCVKILSGVQVWTIHVCLMLPEPLCHYLSLMSPDIVILEYVHVIREEKLHRCKNLLVQVVS